MAQWIRRWSTEPEILGSIPSEVETHPFWVLSFFNQKRSVFGLLELNGVVSTFKLKTQNAKAKSH